MSSTLRPAEHGIQGIAIRQTRDEARPISDEGGSLSWRSDFPPPPRLGNDRLRLLLACGLVEAADAKTRAARQQDAPGRLHGRRRCAGASRRG